MAKKAKGSVKRDKPRERKERQFEPAAMVSANLVYLVGGVGSVLMGIGAWGQFGSLLTSGGPDPFRFAPYILAAGALLVGIAIWIGTSGEPALRVGDGGLAVVKSGLQRMPWYAIERVAWSGDAIQVTGKDDTGQAMTVTATLQTQPQAAAWIVKEARERIPAVVGELESSTLPDPLASAGVEIALEPPQVVGRHCAESGKIIAYEPDARVCVRCERVFHRSSVPEVCPCGASLAGLRANEKSA
jgi:hypothetical protein